MSLLKLFSMFIYRNDSNLLLVAQGGTLIGEGGEGGLLGTGRLLLFEHIHLNMVQYFNEKQQIL